MRKLTFSLIITSWPFDILVRCGGWLDSLWLLITKVLSPGVIPRNILNSSDVGL
jgi:hypothetical protein